MDTRPKDGRLTAKKKNLNALGRRSESAPCPRQRFFAEARKRDEDDVEAHRRGALTPQSAEKIGAAAGVVHE